MQNLPEAIDPDRVTRADAYRLFETYAELSRHLVTRPAMLVGQAQWRLLLAAARGGLGPWSLGATAGTLAREVRDMAADLAAVPAAAAAAASMALASTRQANFSEYPDPLADGTPRTRALARHVDGAAAVQLRRQLAARAGFDPDDAAIAMPAPIHGTPFLLPARVLDASQAWAAWFVPAVTAERLLHDAIGTGHLPPAAAAAFHPFVTSLGRSTVTLWLMDHRAADFGTYREIALSLTVLPQGTAPSEAGQLFLRLVVTDAFSIAPGWQIWGFAKDYCAPGTSIGYGPRAVRFRVGPRGLDVAFPRFGTARSERRPITIYSLTPSENGVAQPVRAAMSCSGSGQGLQYGGAVRLALPAVRERNPDCLSGAGMVCLCATLAQLGLDQASPAVNGWTENLRFTLGASLAL